MVDIKIIPFEDRIGNAFLSYARYIGRMFLPQNLTIFYPLYAGDINSWLLVFYVLLVIVVSVLVIYFGRKQRYLPTGWFWFLGTLVPVIGIVQVGGQAFADRYTYIPYIGLFLMIAWGLPELLSKWQYRKFALGISAVIVLTALGITARWQVSYWNNSIALFSHAVEVTQNNYLAHCSLGVAYNRLGRFQDAVDAFKQAVKIKPDYAVAHHFLGIAYLGIGDKNSAMEQYRILKTLDAEQADKLFTLIYK